MKIKRVFSIIYSYFILIYLELVLRLFTIGTVDYRFLYTMLFAIPAAGVLFILTSVSKSIVNKIIYNAVIFIIGLYFCVQLVYYTVFDGYMSVSLIRMGTNAATNFTAQIAEGIKSSVCGLIAIIGILCVSVLVTCADMLSFDKFEFKFTAVNFVAVIIAHCACTLLLSVGGTGAYTVYDVYHSNDTTTDNSVQNLGMLVTTRLESQQIMFKGIYIANAQTKTVSIDNVKKYSSDVYNVMDIDFNDILDKCASADAASLTVTLSQREPTKKNEYTGIFEGYNLITVCAESFSPYLIDEERTPTLYRLANEGFIFNNFYGSYESVTTNGEYTYCLGMFPDLSRSKKDNSFIASASNALPFTLANRFKDIGADTFAYHNFLGTYYSRNLTHPNMGYDILKTPDNGLDIAPTWPSSDYDMMVKSVDDYIGSGKQFHTYYMTFSGHYQYTWANIMCARNKSLVKDLDYTDTVKAYIAGNMELEKALAYLVKRLEEAETADKTVIVLTTDHYPYGLSEHEYNELADKEIDTVFGKYKNSFICWNGGMKEAVQVDSICSTIDILPTMLNLFGFEYDSRLIPGRDVLSDCSKIAILANQSFITENYRFNATDNQVIITTHDKVDPEEIEKSKNYVKDILSISRAILNTNYYQYITED